MRAPAVVRPAVPSVPLHGSLYLMSALLALAGGYLTLHDLGGRPLTVALREVLGTQLLYQAALLAAAAFLHRVRGDVRDTMVLLGILAAYAVDAPMLQHLYGWDWSTPDGPTAAWTGWVASLVSIAMGAFILRLSPLRRPFVALAVAATFARFAPLVLAGSAGGGAVEPRYVALGWMLATIPLVAFLPGLGRAASRLPLSAIDGMLPVAALAAGALHFVLAGHSFDLAFRPIYLAPFVVLLAPALERLTAGERRPRAFQLSLDGLPYLGLALSASTFPPGLIDARWAQAWPLTPFSLTLILTALVQLHRGRIQGDPTRRSVGALLLVLACLGGDLPEILASARTPRLWQAPLVAVAAWSTILATRRRGSGLVLHALVAFVVAGWLEQAHFWGKLEWGDRGRFETAGYPWMAGFLVALGWGLYALESTTLWLIAPRARLAVAGFVTIVPAAVAVVAYPSLPAGYVAGVSLLAASALAFARRDRLLRLFVPPSAAIVALGLPLAMEHRASTPPGRLLTEAAFLLLVLAVGHSLVGGRVAESWRAWRREVSDPETDADPGFTTPAAATPALPVRAAAREVRP